MNTKHTPGPWNLHKVEANARRIVACVNACEGINPEAVPELRDICESILAKVAAAMPARHDDLTAVSVTFTGADLARLRAAIAKATGNIL